MLPIVKDKQVKSIFYIFNDCQKPVENAINELVKSINLLTEKNIPIKKIDKLEDAKNGVVFATFSSLPKNYFQDDYNYLSGTDGFAVRKKDDNLYVLSHTPGGVFFGAHDLLEKNADIIWTRAKRGEDTSFIKNQELILKNYDYCEKPDFITRGWNTCGQGEQGEHHDLGSIIYLAKNKINAKFELYLDMFSDYGVDVQGRYERIIHNYSEYMESNPEYFMIKENGLPHENRGSISFINYYNEEIAKVVANRYIELFKTKPHTINQRIYFGIPDDAFFRMVENGKIISEEPFTTDDGVTVYPEEREYKSTVFYNFLNRVAKNVHKVYPKAKFLVLAYLYCSPCPKCYVDNSIAVGLCPIGLDEHTTYEDNTTKDAIRVLETFKSWCKKVPDVFYYSYWQSVRGSYPRPLAKNVQKNLRYIKQIGIKHLIPEGYLDGANHLGKDDKFDLNEMYYWLMNKLFWNVESDLDKLTEKYCRLVYGDAQSEMLDFYKLIQQGWDSQDVFVTWCTGNDVYIKKCVIDAGIKDDIIVLLEKALNKPLQNSQKRRIESIYTQMKRQIDNYCGVKNEKAVALYCDMGIDNILSQKELAIEENKDSIWNKTKKLTVFKKFFTFEDYDKISKFNVRMLWDNDNLYIGYQVFDSEIIEDQGLNDYGNPIIIRENGKQVISYAETYLGNEKYIKDHYFGFITGITRDKMICVNDGAPNRIPTPQGFRDSFYIHLDDNPEKRYYFHVQTIAWKDLEFDEFPPKPMVSITYYNDRYRFCGWKGQGLWCKSNLEYIELKKD